MRMQHEKLGDVPLKPAVRRAVAACGEQLEASLEALLAAARDGTADRGSVTAWITSATTPALALQVTVTLALVPRSALDAELAGVAPEGEA